MSQLRPAVEQTIVSRDTVLDILVFEAEESSSVISASNSAKIVSFLLGRRSAHALETENLQGLKKGCHVEV